MNSNEVFAAIKGGDTAKIESLLGADPRLAEAKDEKGVSALLTALYYRQPQIAQALRARRENLDLFEAASLGELLSVKQSLQQHPEYVRMHSADGWTALHLAAFFGHAEIVGWLLDGGAAVDARGTNAMHNTALHAAQVGNHVEVARILLDHGADVNARQHGGFTALHSAAANGCEPMVDLLLARGSDASLRDDSGKNPADVAREKGHTELEGKLTAKS